MPRLDWPTVHPEHVIAPMHATPRPLVAIRRLVYCRKGHTLSMRREHTPTGVRAWFECLRCLSVFKLE